MELETSEKFMGSNSPVVSADNSQDKKIEKSAHVIPQDASNGKDQQVNVSRASRKNIPDKESFQRINYLLQASQIITAQSPRARSVAAYYCSLIHNIAQKSLIRLHPDVKRMMCRGCKCLLFPGINAQVTVKSKPMSQVLWTCFLCGTLRRLPSKRGYELWVQKPEALI
ncbi:Ribonuclease P protein subunit p21 [Gryllus bimaculatus]|nr:Ribonuclease P protein subunit p21 [Gryllus bimaculatus]